MVKTNLMKVILIDPGLKNTKGHNYATDLKIAEFFKRNKFDVEILCLKTIDKETESKFLKNKIKINKVFDISTYSSFPYQNEETFIESVRVSVNNLNSYHKNNLNSGIAIWPPCNFPIQIFTNLFTQIAKYQFIFLEPTFSSFSDNTINMYNKFNKKFIERGDIVYLAVEEEIKKIFLKFLPIKIKISPFLSFSKYKKNKSESLKKIGVFGFNKIIKEQFSERMLDVLENFNIDFEFHDPGKYFKLRRQAEFNNLNFKKIINITNFSFSSFTDDLNSKIANYDAIIYFFNPIYYQLIPSGIIAESIATGRPIILPKKNNPAKLVKTNKCGVFFKWDEPESLKLSIENLIKNYKSIKKNTIISSNKWHKSQGINNFYDFIINEI